MNDPREAKLPVWARTLLQNERHRATMAERKLAEHLDTVEETRISYGDYDNPIYIPNHFGLQTVRFDVAKHPSGGVYDSINVGLRPDHAGVLGIEVMGGHTITIRPQASNVVRIEHERD